MNIRTFGFSLIMGDFLVSIFVCLGLVLMFSENSLRSCVDIFVTFFTIFLGLVIRIKDAVG